MNSTIPPPGKPKKVDPLIDTVVNGKFKILALVAAGGMGKIYRAEQIALNRPVALKVLHAQNGSNEDDPQFKKRFFREASILARLQHPNIVTVFDYGAIDGAETERFYMAMEFLSGQTLGRRISERTQLSPKDTIKIARQIARGLTEAHAQGVIHRDLKPSNVMLVHGRDGEDVVKIVDFGIVKIVGDDSQETEDLTQEGSFIGSPKYMAPEQITRGGKIDVRTDVYSFGIILYQCLTGVVPFDAPSSIQTLMAHLNHPPMPIRERVPNLGIPDWLEQIVMSCIEKDPALRPQTMDGVARALAEAEAAFTSGRGLSAISGPSLSALAPVDGRPGSMPDLLSSTGRASAPRNPSGITEQGTIASVHPQETDKTRTSPGMKDKGPRANRALLLVSLLAGGATLMALGFGAFFLLRRPPPPAEVHAAPIAPPAVVKPKETFALTIESTPSGAEVRDGDRVLGLTPVQVLIDNGSARAEPRRFTLSMEGYLPYSLAQGPSQESVRLVAPLVAAPAVSGSGSTSASAVARGAAPTSKKAAARGAGPTPSAPPASRPDLDIRMNR